MAATVLTAFCAIDENEDSGWISGRGLISLVTYIFNNGTEYRHLDEEMRSALIFGSLVAMWAIPHDFEFSSDEIMAARSKLIQKVKSRHPPAALIRQALKYWIQHLTNPDSTGRHITLAHLFPIEISTGSTAEITEKLRGPCKSNDANVSQYTPTEEELAALASPRPDGEMPSIWGSLSNRSLIAFFHILGSQSQEAEFTYISALFTLTSTISKSAFTDQWINNRWQSLRQDIPQIADREQVSRGVLENFERIFQKQNKTIAMKVSSLMISSWLAVSVDLPSIVRIVSQARAPHVSGLTALCGLSMNYGNVTFTTLTNTFGAHQTKNIVALALEIIHNPFVTLIGPPVVVSSYADIAFVATEIAFNLSSTNRRQNVRYISPAEKSITKTKPFLMEYALSLFNSQRTAGENETADRTLITSYMGHLAQENETTFSVKLLTEDARNSAAQLTSYPVDDSGYTQIPKANFMALGLYLIKNNFFFN